MSKASRRLCPHCCQIFQRLHITIKDLCTSIIINGHRQKIHQIQVYVLKLISKATLVSVPQFFD